MKTIIIKLTATLVLLMMGSEIVISEEIQMDHEGVVISSNLNRFGDKYLCPDSLTNPMIRAQVDEYLHNHGAGSTPSDDAITIAMYTIFPCPFSPYSREFRPAVEKDIKGTWSYPDTSQKLRFGPKSPNWAKLVALPMKCEAIAYNPDGVVLHAQFSGKTACPFSNASDIEKLFRAYPKVESWKMKTDGRITISRSDIQNHIEEWEVFVVTASHERNGVHFDVGDLVEFVRRENGNDKYNASTQFRHLKWLP